MERISGTSSSTSFLSFHFSNGQLCVAKWNNGEIAHIQWLWHAWLHSLHSIAIICTLFMPNVCRFVQMLVGGALHTEPHPHKFEAVFLHVLKLLDATCTFLCSITIFYCRISTMLVQFSFSIKFFILFRTSISSNGFENRYNWWEFESSDSDGESALLNLLSSLWQYKFQAIKAEEIRHLLEKFTSKMG